MVDYLKKQINDDKVEILVFYDDFLIITPSIWTTFEALKKLTVLQEELGVRVNYKKTQVMPSMNIGFLGLGIHAGSRSITVPMEKKINLILAYLDFVNRPTLDRYQTFIGKANFLCRVAVGSRSLARKLSSAVPGTLPLYPSKCFCQYAAVRAQCELLLRQLVLRSPRLSLALHPKSETLEIYVYASQVQALCGFSDKS